MTELPEIDRFAPLTELEEVAATPTISDAGTDKGECIMPVPGDAPPMPDAHPKLGKPSKRWPYRDVSGALLCEVWRFDLAGGKEFRPLSLRRISGRLEWRWGGVDGLRPLYGLDRLAANPGALVVICEGEKAVDAAAGIFPNSACMTSLNGSQSARKSDWAPLTGRKIGPLA
jgi:putative DNA primase/helicase